jgi:hypothetical protein
MSELAERLPTRLTLLARLAYSYYWAWSAAPALFGDIDPARWRRSGCNPRFRLASLGIDPLVEVPWRYISPTPTIGSARSEAAFRTRPTSTRQIWVQTGR